MWFEALPSMAAMLATLSLLELSPFICHYISWGCPMMRSANGEISLMLLRRDQRVAQNNGINYLAQHMYTFSFNSLTPEVKTQGNYQHYMDAEKRLTEEK